MSIVITLLTVFLVMVSALLILVTLMQRPKQEGLGAAFGGGMMNDTFGAQTTDVLQKSTVWLTVAFFGVAILLTVLNTRYYKSQRDVGNILENVQKAEPIPGFPTPEAISKEATKTPAADSKKAADKAPAKTDAKAAKPTKAEKKADAKKDSAKPAADKVPAKTDAKAANPAKAGEGKAK
ncbi:MAG: preprotein translocase subunit SecG [Verrucomicrobiales bacterium]|nr:preprotein translocase subunit SecG [Verrucomicrobiales bacterium]